MGGPSGPRYQLHTVEYRTLRQRETAINQEPEKKVTDAHKRAFATARGRLVTVDFPDAHPAKQHT